MATNENLVNPQQIREAVKQDYTRVVERSSGCCGTGPIHPEETARRIGYSDGEIQSAPDGANLGVGCGNPTALAALRPGGRLMISDIVLERTLPPEIAEEISAYTGCVAGASVREEYLEQIEKAGFREVSIVREANVSGAYTSNESAGCDCGGQPDTETDQLQAFLENVTSVHVEALK